MLQKPIEEQAAAVGVAAIEPEGELVEVRVQMRGGDKALVRAKQPTLE